MSYQEKRTIVSIISGVLLLAAYCLYVFNKYQSNPAVFDDLKFCGTTILIFIGIGVVAMIIIQILFHIALSIGIAVRERNADEKAIEKELENNMVEDEMDKLIELKAMKIGFIIGGVGFITALVSVIFNSSVAVVLNIMFLSFGLGSLAEGSMSLYYYRKGIKND